jgi:GT2 family glycosyltransferase
MAVDLSFIIPVRNDAAGLARCLASIKAAAAGATTECIVIDNGSSDGSVDVATKAGCRVLTIPHERVGALRNKGAEVATGDVLAFVDADHELAPEWVAAALEVMRDPKVSAVGAPCRPPTPANWVQTSYDGLRDHRPGRHVVEWLGSGNMVVRADVFRRVGGFDATLEACEDVDLSRRIRESGGIIVSDGRLLSVHYGDPASLSALFRGELWRGRNNLQVSLRERPSLRSMPSIVIPVAQLGVLSGTLAALLLRRPELAALGVAAFALPSIARALRIRQRSSVLFSHAMAVASTYDTARALALVMRARHRRVAPGPALTQ